MQPGSHDLDRFVEAQNGDSSYDRAILELQGGQKTGHWIWFIFPQIAGLGHSSVSRRFAIQSLDEAQRYLEHPVLGERLRIAVRTLMAHANIPIADILGSLDAQKLCSCLTLFSMAMPAESVFLDALRIFFGDARDSRTLELLASDLAAD